MRGSASAASGRAADSQSPMSFAVVVFPGSNCDRDCYHVIREVLRRPVCYVAHAEPQIPDVDCVIIPGGFSYGDYLRAGALAARSPVMGAIRDFAAGGGLVLGICNGFQILCETGLLPGALMVNTALQFICRWVHMRIEDVNTPFTRDCKPNQVLRMPIAHYEGNFRPPPEQGTGSAEAEDLFCGRIVGRYCSPGGEVSDNSNPNGSWSSVAAVSNREGNVLGMMPHPERCSEHMLKGSDGLYIFRSLVQWWEEDGYE